MTRPIPRKSNKPSKPSTVTFFTRDATVILRMLEKTAKTLGLEIRYEPIFQDGVPWESDGGLCRVQRENLIMINATAPAEQKCQVILGALRTLNIDECAAEKHIPPVVRQMLSPL